MFSAAASPRRLLLATNNEHKLAELRDIMGALPIALVTPAQIGMELEVEETGETFEANAVLKAIAFARGAGLPALADDSGLEIDALGGAPGVWSKRFAGEGATDADRNQLALERLRGVPAGQRSARFRCVMAVATPEELLGTVEGRVEGQIAEAPRGAHGFGYDPIFLVEGGNRTMAELTATEKNQISHRARAGAAAARLIARWLDGSLGTSRPAGGAARTAR